MNYYSSPVAIRPDVLAPALPCPLLREVPLVDAPLGRHHGPLLARLLVLLLVLRLRDPRHSSRHPVLAVRGGGYVGHVAVLVHAQGATGVLILQFNCVLTGFKAAVTA